MRRVDQARRTGGRAPEGRLVRRSGAGFRVERVLELEEPLFVPTLLSPLGL